MPVHDVYPLTLRQAFLFYYSGQIDWNGSCLVKKMTAFPSGETVWTPVTVLGLESQDSAEEWFLNRAPAQELRDCYEEGRDAGLEGAASSDNPYTETDRRICWETGWQSCQPSHDDDFKEFA